ncbi:unnamed protein product [Tenebrio molitor]|nr:unnamed protein product [Tenebrio molitor]
MLPQHFAVTEVLVCWKEWNSSLFDEFLCKLVGQFKTPVKRENCDCLSHLQTFFYWIFGKIFLLFITAVGTIAIIKFWTSFFCHKKNYSKSFFIEIVTHEG